MQEHVNLVDLVKSFLFELDSYSNEYLLAQFGFDTAENEPLSFKFARSPRTDPPGSAQEKRGEDLGSVRNRNIDVG